jgi:enoyl-[acyl-carrier-protein] reductase (NADH)
MASSTTQARKKVALIMGVANQRSIAWACVESFLRTNNYDCILTYQSERFRTKVDRMVLTANAKHMLSQHQNNHNHSNHNTGTSILASLPCNVQTDLPTLFHDVLPEILQQQDGGDGDGNDGDGGDGDSGNTRKIDAIVHSLAYANFEGHGDKLSQASWQAFAEAQHISAYSFLETARCATESNLLWQSNANANVSNTNTSNANSSNTNPSNSNTSHTNSSSLTALSYIGASRSVPGYHIMGPAKASLEAIVRGLAAEFGTNSNCNATDGSADASASIRVNCVSAGPVQTAAARGIPGFSKLAAEADRAAPTGNPNVHQVANVVQWVADSSAVGVTGQTIYVDGGYSTTVSVPVVRCPERMNK